MEISHLAVQYNEWCCVHVNFYVRHLIWICVSIDVAGPFDSEEGQTLLRNNCVCDCTDYDGAFARPGAHERDASEKSVLKEYYQVFRTKRIHQH